MIGHLKRTLRYMNRFGVVPGLGAALRHAAGKGRIPVRIPGYKHPVVARAGTSDIPTFDQVFVARQYDLPLEGFRPRHILDLGANVGFSAVFFANAWPEARILAVEPSTENMAVLQENIAPFRQIEAIQGAVWPHEAELAIANPDDEAWAFRMEERPSAADPVPAYSMPTLLHRFRTPVVDLVKMDVEGAEREIFQADTSWLDHVRVLVVELHDRFVPGCGQALFDALHGRSYRFEMVGENVVIQFGDW